MFVSWLVDVMDIVTVPYVFSDKIEISCAYI